MYLWKACYYAGEHVEAVFSTREAAAAIVTSIEEVNTGCAPMYWKKLYDDLYMYVPECDMSDPRCIDLPEDIYISTIKFNPEALFPGGRFTVADWRGDDSNAQNL